MEESRFKKYREEQERGEKRAEHSNGAPASPAGNLLILVLLAAITGVWGYYFTSKIPSKEVKRFSGGRSMKVVFFDVGQGDAALVVTPSGSSVLIDAGGRPGYPSEENADALPEKNDYASSVIIPRLKTELKFDATGHIPVFVDCFIATNPLPEHIGGMLTLLEDNILPKKIYLCGSAKKYRLYTDFLDKVKSEKLSAEDVSPGRVIDFEDGASAEFFGPLAKYSGTGADDANSSVVAKFTYKNVSFLFTSDIQLAAENDLGNWRGNLGAAVLKVAAHGSRASTSSPFLDKVSPRYAVISCGRDNVSGFPHQSVVKRLTDRDIKIYRTDANGTVTFYTDGNLISVETGR